MNASNNLPSTKSNPTVLRVLTINTGSSSLKTALYEMGQGEKRLLSGEVERIGLPASHLRLVDAQGATLIERESNIPDHGAALEVVLAGLQRQRPELQPDAAGHRLVHGGTHSEPQRITPELTVALQALVPLAPNHLPQALQAIRATANVFPDLPQVACFDTAFHRRMPRTAQLYPLPRHLGDEGVVRYGFHGLSYEYIMQALRATAPQEAEGRVIIAHLGNGASMAAVRGGIGIETTMGFTPAGGLVMGTRSGDLDPGVLLYLLAERKLTPATLADLVNRQAGLLGVSGTSADMRDLLDKESADPRAAEAIDLFCYQARKFLGALAAVLGGLDTLVFTAGIGEHAPPVRRRICEGLEFLGIELDLRRNEEHAPVISRDRSPVTVRVLRTDEDLMIARHTAQDVSRTTGLRDR